jgi:hypothetical protein
MVQREVRQLPVGDRGKVGVPAVVTAGPAELLGLRAMTEVRAMWEARKVWEAPEAREARGTVKRRVT